jgi:uncharacterized protein (DUF2249 family)
MPRLDVRDLPPGRRHPRIVTAFTELDSGETLELVDDHEPKPLVDELRSEGQAFDSGAYEVEGAAPEAYVAMLPKQ